MTNGSTSDVDAYINENSPKIQSRLKQLRKLIVSTLPKEAEETTAWGMPTYRFEGKNRVHFAVFKNHIGLFVGAEVIARLGDKLDGFTTSKAVIHLPHEKPLSEIIVKAAVREALKADGIDSAPQKRQSEAMPDFVRRELNAHGLMEAYDSRPPYQRNDYLAWINTAKQDATKQRRLEQMLSELVSGDTYMGMPYKTKWVLLSSRRI